MHQKSFDLTFLVFYEFSNNSYKIVEIISLPE